MVFRPTGARPVLLPVAMLAVGLSLGPASAAAGTQSPDYVIGSPDVLLVTVWNQDDLSGSYAVETDGTFTFPLVGRVTAAGLTLRAFEEELERLLADGFFKKPEVTVTVSEYRSQRIFVVGEVRQPGTYALTGGMRLIEAIATAGSTSANASRDVVVVRANGSDRPVLPDADDATEVVRIDLRDLQRGVAGQNVLLQDGDTVFVPLAEVVYVFGQVRSPGSYPIQRDTTVLQALSLAGGVTEFGATNRIDIVRTVDGEQVEVRVTLTDRVQPGDTIMVPERFF